MGFEINLSGIRKRIAAMQEMAGDTAIDMVNELTGIGEAQAKAVAPVDTGLLRETIHMTPAEIKGDEVEGSWGTNNEYAIFNEYGTGQGGMSGLTKNNMPKDPDDNVAYREDWQGMIASPFMYPSSKLVAEEMPRIHAKYAGRFLGEDKGND